MNEYEPDRVSHPGETLKEIMKEKQLTVEDVSILTSLSTKVIAQILSRKKGINAFIGAKLADKGIGPSATFWALRQQNYDEQEI